MRHRRIHNLLLAGLLVAAASSAGCGKSEIHAAPTVGTVPPEPVPVDTLVSAAPDTGDGGAIMMPAHMRRILVRRDSLWQRALALHYDAIVIDGHVDTPTLMLDKGYELGNRHRAHYSHVDLPRMFEGGLDAVFFSIYIAPGYGEGASAMDRALRMIDVVENQIRERADSVALATTAEEVRSIARSGRKAVLLGLEGGHAIGGHDAALTTLFDRGVRYVTVTHINSNSWADASQSAPRWNGLNEKGRVLVRRMNDLGMILDVSHASDSTFFDVMEESSAPVLLSHSSARSLTPNVRNVSDDMLRAVRANGGVVMVNFFDAMVNQRLDADFMREVDRRLPGPQKTYLWNVVYDVRRERGLPGAQLSDVVDHIDHMVRIAGIDHVGLGSDFDGVFDLPGGLEDVTRLPWITYELLARGYGDEDVRKILGGNMLRLMAEVERAALPREARATSRP